MRPASAREARSALALLREPGWAGALLGVLALSVLFVFLGRWQWNRHETRQVKAERIAANYDADPVALTALMPDPGRTLPRADDWRPVRLRGSYLVADTTLVRNRPLDGPGYEVLVPLRTEDGHVVVVDRGWLPTGTTGSAPDAVPAAPTGTVDVLARMRPGEPPIDRDPPRGQALRIDLERLARTWGTPLAGGYGVLATETPAPADTPLLLPRPDLGTDINLPYSAQWYAFAGVAYVLLAVGMVREVRRRATLPGAAPEPGPDGAPDRATPGGVPADDLRRKTP